MLLLPQRRQQFVRRFGHDHVTGTWNNDGARIRRRRRERLAGLRGCHHVTLAENEGRGHLDLRRGREPVLIGIAGVEIGRASCRERV